MVNIFRLALQVQDASNPNGVVNSLANEVMPAIRRESGYQQQGTPYLANHPALILFLDKLNSMAGLQSIGDQRSYDRISAAYTLCHQLENMGDYELDAMVQIGNPDYFTTAFADYRAALERADRGPCTCGAVDWYHLPTCPLHQPEANGVRS